MSGLLADNVDVLLATNSQFSRIFFKGEKTFAPTFGSAVQKHACSHEARGLPVLRMLCGSCSHVGSVR
jgi:hypothetical protein